MAAAYDLVAFDLDGVVYVGEHAVSAAVPSIAALRAAGTPVAFVTNNAYRPPGEVAEHLRALGIDADERDVVTSAQAAAHELAQRLPPGSPVFLIGGAGLRAALAEVGLRAVTEVEADPVAVVQGYAPDLPWERVIAGSILVRRGLPWVVANTDRTLPTPSGIGPGSGMLVTLVKDFADTEPVVAGKPSASLFARTRARTGARHPLFVGDRLDTDILGARGAGWDSLLVMTGVTGLADVVAAPPGQRPTQVGADISALLRARAVPVADGPSYVAGGWRVTVDDDARPAVTGTGQVDDWWSAMTAAAWAHLDHTGRVVDVAGVEVPRPVPAA